MTRIVVFLSSIFFAAHASAHPGHLADVAGHDHWVAGAAIGLAIAIGLIGALKGKAKSKDPDEAEAEDEEAAA